LTRLHVYGLGDDETEFLSLSESHILPKDKPLCFYFDYIKSYPLDKKSVKVLILREPRVVLPSQYSRRKIKEFDLVISMGHKRARDMSLKYTVAFPYEMPRRLPYNPSNSRVNSVVLINSNKFGSIAESNYGLRRLAIKEFQKTSFGISLYGPNWRLGKLIELRKRLYSLRDTVLSGMKPSLKETFSGFSETFFSWKGESSDKLTTLSKYRFALVIENQSDYVSEKLLDSIFAGCIPIYIGPEFEGKYEVLEGTVIRISKEELRASRLEEKLTDSDLNKIARNILTLQGKEDFWLALSKQRVFSSILDFTAKFNLNSKT